MPVAATAETKGAYMGHDELSKKMQAHSDSADMDMELDVPTDAATNELLAEQAHEVFLAPDVETVICFDWDDTLLASSYLSAKGYRLDDNMVRDPEVEAQLRQLERSVCVVLTLALEYGEVHIITNAEHGWVEMSAAKFMPQVAPLLARCVVVSARSSYEEYYPGDPLKWKICAFQDQLNEGFSSAEASKNLLSFGDSQVEREAVRTVSSALSAVRTKSVKFAERPSMEQLRRQIDLVTNCFQYIYSHDGDLDLMLTISLMY